MPLLAVRLVAEFGLLCGLLGLLLRCLSSRKLTVLTFAVLGLRVMVALPLYFISAYSLPFFRGFHYAPGFWSFAPDASVYDFQARQILSGQMPDPLRQFALLVAATYWSFGESPVSMLILNAALAAACVPLAYFIATRLTAGKTLPLLAGAVVGLWPSSIIWGSQVLRDPTQWLASFLVLAGATMVLATDRPPERRALIGAGLLIASGEAVFSWLLPYYNAFFLLALAMGGVALLLHRKARAHGLRLRIGALVGAMLIGLLPSPVLPFAVLTFVKQIHANPSLSGMTQEQAKASSSAISAANDCKPLWYIIYFRSGFVEAGGDTLVSSQPTFKTCADVLTYVPRAIQLVFLGELPWSGDAGYTLNPQGAIVLTADSAFLWLLLPGWVAALQWLLRLRGGPVLLVLVIYCLGLGLTLGLVVANFGTLSRQRLEVILPSVVISAVGWQLIWDAASARFRRNVQRAGEALRLPA